MLPEQVPQQVRRDQLRVQRAVSDRRRTDEDAGRFSEKMQAHAVLLRAFLGFGAVAAFREHHLRRVLDVRHIVDLQRRRDARTRRGVIILLLTVPVRLALDPVKIEVGKIAAVKGREREIGGGRRRTDRKARGIRDRLIDHRRRRDPCRAGIQEDGEGHETDCLLDS